ncbi:MAG TPA: hypothetical protein DDW89_04000 [Gammaproteobacteria bacterium]|nr:hypothetical protein [Gammaproteobacteria bacterium]
MRAPERWKSDEGRQKTENRFSMLAPMEYGSDESMKTRRARLLRSPVELMGARLARSLKESQASKIRSLLAFSGCLPHFASMVLHRPQGERGRAGMRIGSNASLYPRMNLLWLRGFQSLGYSPMLI